MIPIKIGILFTICKVSCPTRNSRVKYKPRSIRTMYNVMYEIAGRIEYLEYRMLYHYEQSDYETYAYYKTLLCKQHNKLSHLQDMMNRKDIHPKETLIIV
jgi:hypothetical protein